jgi:membrane associated rhomboid family serine protease
MLSLKEEKEKMYRAVYFPVMFIICIWTLHLLKYLSIIDIDDYGVFPRTLTGLRGIFFTPLIHDDFNHLFNNSIPLLILGSGLFYFYSDLAPRIILWIWVISGLGIWFIGRDAYHIGASGVVYGLAAFLFFSGIFRNIIRLIAMALLVIFLYGSLVWGLFPIKMDISWEGHLFGAVAGTFLSFFYLKEGPQPEKPGWMEEPEEDDDDDSYYKIDPEDEISENQHKKPD